LEQATCHGFIAEKKIQEHPGTGFGVFFLNHESMEYSWIWNVFYHESMTSDLGKGKKSVSLLLRFVFANAHVPEVR